MKSAQSAYAFINKQTGKQEHTHTLAPLYSHLAWNTAETQTLWQPSRIVRFQKILDLDIGVNSMAGGIRDKQQRHLK